MSEPYPTIEELLSLPRVGGPTVSDDGRHLAYVRTETDWEDNRYRDHVWLHDVGAGRTYPLTQGKDASSSPVFSPDSSAVAYLAKSGDKRQVFVRTVGEGSGVAVTHAPEGVNWFKWSADGRELYYIATPSEPDGRKRRKDVFGDFEHVDREHRRSSLYRIDVETGLAQARASARVPKDQRDDKAPSDPAERLTDPDTFHVTSFDVCPDGKRVAFVAAPTPDLADMDSRALYMLDRASGDVSELAMCGRAAGSPMFSPDGNTLAYTRPSGSGSWYENAVLQLLDLRSGATRRLLHDIDEHVTPVRFTSAGIVCSWSVGTLSRIGLVSTDDTLRVLVEGEGLVALAPCSAGDASLLAYVGATPTQRSEVYLGGRRITDESASLGERTWSRKELVSWTSLDGVRIEGVLSSPPEREAGRRHPLLVAVHGGPAATSLCVPTTSRTYPIESFVERGFLVLEPNYRGSSGYGEAFRARNFRDMGTGDYADVSSGVDALVERGLADPERVGVMGWSQGGYIAAFCATYGNGRFRAASVGAGISNWVTYYVNTDIHPFTRHYLGATPWDDPEVYARTSPITYVKQARTPTLIQHGERDARVPLPNAYELYQGLRDQGVDVELVVFKGMGHGATKPGIHRAIMRQNLAWFCHHILGDPLDNFRLDASPEPQAVVDAPRDRD